MVVSTPNGMHYREDGEPKRGFEWIDEARQASATHFNRDGELVMPYRCKVCGLWHVGHVERRSRKRRHRGAST